MREILLKKRYGIPAALLLVLLLSGTAIACYCFATISSTTTVEEPLSVGDHSKFSETMYPGENNNWTFSIWNSADVSYDIKADLTFSAPNGVSITDFTIIDGPYTTDETDDLLDDGSAVFTIPAKEYIHGMGERISCIITISAAKDATPGTVSVSLDLSRE